MDEDDQPHDYSISTTATKSVASGMEKSAPSSRRPSESDTTATGRQSAQEEKSGSQPENLGQSIASTKQHEPRIAPDITSTDGIAASVVSGHDQSQANPHQRFFHNLAGSLIDSNGNLSERDRLFMGLLAGQPGATNPTRQGDRSEDGDVSKQG